MQTSVKERLIKFYESKNINRSAFEKLCGLSNGYMVSLRHAPSNDKLSNILRAFPDLNRVWLLTGEGPMTTPQQPSITNNQVGEASNNSQVTITNNQGELAAVRRHLDSALSETEYLRKENLRLLAIVENLTSR